MDVLGLSSRLTLEPTLVSRTDFVDKVQMRKDQGLENCPRVLTYREFCFWGV